MQFIGHTEFHDDQKEDLMSSFLDIDKKIGHMWNMLF